MPTFFAVPDVHAPPSCSEATNGCVDRAGRPGSTWRRSNGGSRPAAIVSLAFLSLQLATVVANASDGVLEINQACAEQTGCFPGDAPGFPVDITATNGRSYRLTGDLSVPDENTTAIVIVGDVTLDLAGFQLSGVTTCINQPPVCSPLGAGIGIERETGQGSIIRNGTIRGFGSHGISPDPVLLGFGGPGPFRIEQVRVIQNGGHGIRLIGPALIEDCAVEQNGLAGIDVSGDLVVTHTSVAKNGGNGIDASGQSVIVDNLVRSNGGDGVTGGSGSQISGNSIVGNGGDGVVASLGSTVTRNSVRLSDGDGIRAIQGGSSIFDNTLQGNQGDGIDCTDGSRSYVRGNSAIQNGGFGLNLDDPPPDPDAIYRANNVYDNVAGTVTGGNNRGDNSCRSNGGGPITDCP